MVAQTQPTTATQPRMTKAQSEIRLPSSTVGRPEHDRRHKSQSGAPPRHPPHPYTVYRRRQQQQAQAAAAAAAAIAKKIQTLAEEPSEPPQMSHDYARRLHNMSRDLSHDNEGGEGGGGGGQQQLRNSVDREIAEDPALRKEFPNVEGTLFEVWLNKGSRGLGMSIVANRDDHAPGPRGIVIMGIQPGGVADRSKMITLGDMILKINDQCVIGMTQLEVQEMLIEAAQLVKFVMLRSEGKALDRTVSNTTNTCLCFVFTSFPASFSSSSVPFFSPSLSLPLSLPLSFSPLPPSSVSLLPLLPPSPSPSLSLAT